MNEAMNKIMKHMSIAALALTGALMSSCATDDDIIENAPQVASTETAKKDNIVVVTTTVTRGDNQTKALNIDYMAQTLTKTFAVDEKMSLQYINTSDEKVKAVSNPLTEGDITNDGKTAKLTFTLVNPKENCQVKFIYPAAMAGDDGNADFSKLSSQYGTLSSLGSSLDLTEATGSMAGYDLPENVTMNNSCAIIAFTPKNAGGTEDISSDITQFTVSDGTNTYTVNRPAVGGTIFVAMQPISSRDLTYTATAGGKTYKKFVSNKTYAAGNFYQQGLRMGELVDLSTLTDDYDAKNGDVLTGTLAGNYSIDIAHGATVTLDNVNINGNGTWAGDHSGIECQGNATIILKGENVVKGFSNIFAGISATNTSCTLTIDGDGSLTASSKDSGAGIGGIDSGDCANIVINGGTINATGGPNGGAGIGGGNNAACGNITINGGNVRAQGGSFAAGIGCGSYLTGKKKICGDITINGGYVTAQGGAASAGIGSCYGYGDGECSCGNIIITGGTIEATGGYHTFDATQYCGAGIGSGATAGCGTITIANTVTRVKASRGGESAKSIGAGTEGTCGTVTIGGTVYADGIAESPYTYQP